MVVQAGCAIGPAAAEGAMGCAVGLVAGYFKLNKKYRSLDGDAFRFF